MTGTPETTSEMFSERNGVLVQVDHDICAGFGDCLTVAPEVFELSEDDLALVTDADADDLDTLREAAEICPVSAILLFDADGVQIAPNL